MLTLLATLLPSHKIKDLKEEGPPGVQAQLHPRISVSVLSDQTVMVRSASRSTGI